VQQSEIAGILASHSAWTNGDPHGRLADFSYCNLASLAIPAETDLHGARFVGAELTNISFVKSNLARCNFVNAVLDSTTFVDCTLREADFSDTSGLLPKHFAGSDLTGAKLPTNLALEQFSRVTGSTDTAKRVLLSLLTGSVSVLLYSLTVPDYSLIANTPARGISLGGATVTYIALAVMIPIALLCGFLHLQLQLQRLWHILGSLPRRWTDGRSLNYSEMSWRVADIALPPRHDLDDFRLSNLDRALNAALVWWSIPITLATVWVRCLVCHNWYLSALQGFLLTASLIIAFSSRELARKAAARVAVGADLWTDEQQGVPLIARHAVIGFLLFVVITGIASGIIAIPLIKADLVGEDVSTKPAEWTDYYRRKGLPDKDQEQLGRVKGIDFRRRDLRECDAHESFLAKGNFAGANFRGADLSRADLRLANLEGVDLRDARLNYASVDDAFLTDARLDGADLRNLDLSQAHGLTRAQLSKAKTDATTTLPHFAP
jgi:uncharacterized protein YjbI with pentapeptide repeats